MTKETTDRETTAKCRGCLGEFLTRDLRDRCCSPRCREDVARAEREARELAAIPGSEKPARLYRYDWQRFGLEVRKDEPLPAGLKVLPMLNQEGVAELFLVDESATQEGLEDGAVETVGEASEPRDRPLVLRVGSAIKFPVYSLEEASARYQQIRDQSGQGASDFPPGFVGSCCVSYNGRVWLGETLVLEAARYSIERRESK